MGLIFISHATCDKSVAIQVLKGLEAKGYQTNFLDSDPDSGIQAGKDWERDLYRNLKLSAAVVVLCSPESMNSKWCFAEIAQAKAMGKALFPVVVRPCDLISSLSDRQAIRLDVEDEATAFARLFEGLRLAGLDPLDSFGWDSRRPPYPGFLAFDTKDAGIFFGRETEVRGLIELMTRLTLPREPRLAIVVGSSGSGKSSIVRAGAVPRLAKDTDHWTVVPTIRPQTDPFDELTRALVEAFPEGPSKPDYRELRNRFLHESTHPGEKPVLIEIADDLTMALGHRESKLLLVIDQAEELTQITPPDEAARFLDAMVRALTWPGGRVFGLWTLRSDFLGTFQNHPDFRGMNFANVPLGPMPREAFPLTIEGPADRAGISLEPGLVATMVADAQADDALPLLAFTLREMYELCKESGRFTLQVYINDLERLNGAVGKAVKRIETRITPDLEPSVRRAFMRLVRVNENGQYCRRRARWADLPDLAAPILQEFVAARLLTSDADSVEPTHEALFRVWPRLATWLDQGRELMLWKKSLADELADWTTHNRPDDRLLTGARAAEAKRWLDETPDDFDPTETEFLKASIQAEKSRVERLRRLARNLAIAAGVAILLTAVSSGFGYYAYLKQGEAVVATAKAEDEAKKARTSEKTAREAQQTAEHQTGVATVQSLAAQAQLAIDEYPQRALILASEAVRVARASPEPVVSEVPAKQILYDALARSGGRPIGDPGSTNMLSNADDRRQLWTIEDPTENRPVTQTLDLDEPNLKIVTSKSLPIGPFTQISPDGRWLFGPVDGHIEVRDVDHPDTPPIELRNPPNLAAPPPPLYPGRKPILFYVVQKPQLNLVMSPDGQRLAAFTYSRTGEEPEENRIVWTWDLRDPKAPPVAWKGATKGVSNVVFSPNGQWMVMAHQEGQVVVWDLRHREFLPRLQTVAMNSKLPWGLDFVGSSRLVISSRGTPAHLWPLDQPGTRQLTFDGMDLFAFSYGGGVFRSRSGRWLVTSAPVDKSCVWDLEKPETPAFEIPDRDLRRIAFDRDEKRVAVLWSVGTLRVYSLESETPGKLLANLTSRPGLESLALSPDGSHLAVSRGRSALVWDLRSQPFTEAAWPTEYPGCEEHINCLWFSADNRRLITHANQTIPFRVWDLGEPRAAPRTVHTFSAPVLNVNAPGLGRMDVDGVSPGGRWLLLGSTRENAHTLIDLASPGRKSARHLEGRGIGSWTFGPDDLWLVGTPGYDETIGSPVQAHDLNDPGRGALSLKYPLYGFPRPSFLADGRGVVLLGKENAAVWEFGKPERSLGLPGEGVLAVSNDGRWAAVVTQTSGVKLHNLAEPKLDARDLGTIATFGQLRPLACFDPASRKLFICERNAFSPLTSIVCHDLNRPGDAPRTIKCEAGTATRIEDLGMVFTPDGRRVLIFTRHRSIRVYDLERLEEPLVEWRGHDNWITTAMVSPDGHWFLTSEPIDGKPPVLIWNLATLDPNPIRFPHDPERLATIFGPGGRELLMIYDRRGEIVAWPLDMKVLLDRARETAGRNLTADEWRRYLPGVPYRKTFDDLPAIP